MEPAPGKMAFWVDMPDPRKAYADPIPPMGMEYRTYPTIMDYYQSTRSSRLAWGSNSGEFTLSWMQGPVANDDCNGNLLGGVFSVDQRHGEDQREVRKFQRP